MDIILVGGLWLDGSVWDQTVAELAPLGHRAIPVTLPGQGDGRADATLADQRAAVIAAVDAAEKPLVIGHSAACTLAWLAADARPNAVAGVGLIGGFPTTPGEPYAAFFPVVDGAMAFPGWEPFAGPDIADIAEADLADLAARAVPVPEGVATAIVGYDTDKRYAVPVTMICPEFSPEQAKEWVQSGELPELAAAQQVTYVDIDSGHWPMVSAPADLARVIDGIARATA